MMTTTTTTMIMCVTTAKTTAQFHTAYYCANRSSASVQLSFTLSTWPSTCEGFQLKCSSASHSAPGLLLATYLFLHLLVLLDLFRRFGLGSLVFELDLVVVIFLEAGLAFLLGLLEPGLVALVGPLAALPGLWHLDVCLVQSPHPLLGHQLRDRVP